MALVDLVMPKMGESIIEATILKWEKQVGDTVEMDEDILLIATDKVDTEVPSPVEGTIQEILFEEGETVEVGKVIARIATEGETVASSPTVVEAPSTNGQAPKEDVVVVQEKAPVVNVPAPVNPAPATAIAGTRFYSPLVKNIALQEGIGIEELESIGGTGAKGRVTKSDMLAYVKQRGTKVSRSVESTPKPSNQKSKATTSAAPISLNGGEEIIEMDRMRKLIADHMVMSKHTSPHVTSFVEADVTNLFNWRNKKKGEFMERYGERLTFTPIFVEAVTQAIKDFPMVNVSVRDGSIVLKKYINIGMAAALPSGNLIVPVIKNADRLNLAGIAGCVNDLAKRARENKLKPDEIQGGTFTLTNVGTFGNLSGTPIINQPQVAILSTGVIKKKPAVLETEYGDVIAIRHLMMMSMSYDHRVVDGFLGGSFLRRVADYLEQFDPNRPV